MNLLQTNTLIEENLIEAREILSDNITLSQVLEDNNIHHTGSKGKIVCPNPEHDDGSPSFFYDDNTGQCNCFGCNLKGSVVELNRALKLAENPSFSQLQSMLDLARTYQVRIPSFYTRKAKRDIIRKSSRNRGDSFAYDRVYKAKVLEFEKVIKRAIIQKKITFEEALSYYNIIDDMWLDKATVKETYDKLK